MTAKTTTMTKTTAKTATTTTTAVTATAYDVEILTSYADVAPLFLQTFDTVPFALWNALFGFEGTPECMFPQFLNASYVTGRVCLVQNVNFSDCN